MYAYLLEREERATLRPLPRARVVRVLSPPELRVFTLEELLEREPAFLQARLTLIERYWRNRRDLTEKEQQEYEHLLRLTGQPSAPVYRGSSRRTPRRTADGAREFARLEAAILGAAV